MRRTVCLLAFLLACAPGCVSADPYQNGYRAAKADARAARKQFGATAEPMTFMAVMLPGHHTADKSADWRTGYRDGMKEEFPGFSAPPHWGDVRP